MNTIHPQPNSNLSALSIKGLPEVEELVSKVGVSLMIYLFRGKDSVEKQLDKAFSRPSKPSESNEGLNDVYPENQAEAETQEEPKLGLTQSIGILWEKFLIKIQWYSFCLKCREFTQKSAAILAISLIGAIAFEITNTNLNLLHGRNISQVMDSSERILYRRAVTKCDNPWYSEILSQWFPALIYSDAECLAAWQDFRVGPNAPRDAGKQLSEAANLALQNGESGWSQATKQTTQQVLAEHAQAVYAQAYNNLQNKKEVASVESNH